MRINELKIYCRNYRLQLELNLGNALLWCCIFLLLESLQDYFHSLCDQKWLQKHFQTHWETFRTMARTSARFYGSFFKKCENKILTIRIVTGYYPDIIRIVKISLSLLITKWKKEEEWQFFSRIYSNKASKHSITQFLQFLIESKSTISTACADYPNIQNYISHFFEKLP